MADCTKITAAFDLISRKMRPGLGAKEGGAGAEQKYGTAYQRMVRECGAPQIKRKYRG